jgi:excinuclease ABC subunit A
MADREPVVYIPPTMPATFEELTPQNFSYNSPLGWCPACQGLGIERGTEQAAIISNPNLSLWERAIGFWPDPRTNALFARILTALAAELGIDVHKPWYQLAPLAQRAVLYGLEREFTVPAAGTQPGFKFLYKGIYPSIEEATRVSYTHRTLFQDLVGERPCSVCNGDRVREDAASVRLNDTTLPQLCKLPLTEALEFLKGIQLDKSQKKIAGDLLAEAIHRLEFLVEVGLHYLSLDRGMPTLSGGESQRIRLAGQIGRALTGVLYVLDEPTIGLHPRDNGRLIGALHRLRDLGNTVVLVEHDREVLEAADRLYDFGPGSGRHGGQITAEGTPAEIEADGERSLTGAYLSGAKGIPVPKVRRLVRRETRDERREPEGKGQEASDKGQGAKGKKGKKGGKTAKALFNASETVATLSPSPSPGGRGEPEAVSGHPPSAIGHSPPSNNQEPGTKNPSNSLSSLLSPEPAASAVPLTDMREHYEAPPGGAWIELTGARQNNLRQGELHIPLGAFTCVTGLSGSGKSSLVMETLARAVSRKLTRSGEAPGPHDELRGTEKLNKVILVDQSPLGSTPASNPATYTGVWEPIRDLFTRIPDAKIRGFKPARFSFNRPGGRCDDCEGMGQKKIEMHFLPDVWVECATCRGKRFNKETLAVTYKDHSIADVLNMSIGQALELFGNIPKIRAPLATLAAIGLDYLTLGQSAATLSGGEAQRVKLAAELARPNNGQTLYILDEPTTGLHFDDILKLMKVLMSLVEQGNTVVVIEHNLDVIKTADWVIDLGPEAGVDGGWIVAEGTPEDVVAQAAYYSVANDRVSKKAQGLQPLALDPAILWASSRRERYQRETKRPVPIRSWTGELLAPIIENETRGEIEIFRAEEAAKKQVGDIDLRHVGKETDTPWKTDGRRWHTQDRLSHTGLPCRWEGTALELVIDSLAQRSELAPVNWNHRSVVEVMSTDKTGGWFLHAQTADEWLLTLKFRVKKGTFDEATLQKQLPLKPLDQLDELPVYGRGDRVKVKNLKGPFQEVTITVHWLREIDTPAFQKFLAAAINSYGQQASAAALVIGDLAPWKVLGRKWHLSRKGFPSAKRVDWEAETLDELFSLIEGIATGGAVEWGGKQTVTWTRAREEKPAIEVNTKRRTSIDLELYGPAGRFGLGQISTLGETREVATARDGRQVVQLSLISAEQVQDPALRKFLKEMWKP